MRNKEVVIPVRKDTVKNAAKRQTVRGVTGFIGRHKLGTALVGLTLISGVLDQLGTTWEPAPTIGDKHIEFAIGDPERMSQDTKETGIFYGRIQHLGAVAFDISTVVSPSTGGDVFLATPVASPQT